MECFDRLSTNGWEMISTTKFAVILNAVKDPSFWLRKGFVKHLDSMSREVTQAPRFFAALRMTMLSLLWITR